MTASTLLGVATSAPQPGTNFLDVQVKGLRELSVYVEPADQLVTGYTIKPGFIMETSSEIAAGRAIYSTIDQQAETGLTAGSTLLDTQQEQGRWYHFRVPAGALRGCLWLEAVTGGGTLNLLITGGR